MIVILKWDKSGATNGQKRDNLSSIFYHCLFEYWFKCQSL